MADEGAFDRFIERWRRNEGGAERANFPLFLTELCALLDLPQPDPADATHEHNDYVFERDVTIVSGGVMPVIWSAEIGRPETPVRIGPCELAV